LEAVDSFLKANPLWLVFLFLSVVAAIIIGGAVYLKYKKPKESKDCVVDPCFYKEQFKEKTTDIKALSCEIASGNKLLEETNKKIDDNSKENRDAFTRMISISDKQNEALTKICTILDVHTQLLMKSK